MAQDYFTPQNLAHREPGIVQLETRSNAGIELTEISFRNERHIAYGFPSSELRGDNRNRQRGASDSCQQL
jgi:hypothetical protein